MVDMQCDKCGQIGAEQWDNSLHVCLRCKCVALIRERDTERAAHDATRESLAALDTQFARATVERDEANAKSEHAMAIAAGKDETCDRLHAALDAARAEAEHDAWAARVHDAREAMRAALAPRDATTATSAVKCPACHGAGFVPGGAG